MNKQIYTIQEVIDNFKALLNGVDFSYEFDILQVSKFQFRRRKIILLELTALYIALWKFAMANSLPTDGQLIYDSFLAEYTKQNTLEEIEIINIRIAQYTDLLTIHGNNYMYVSTRIISFSQLEEHEIKSTTLRFALGIRQKYTQIFDRLV